MALEDFNGTRSTIIDEVNGVYQSPPTADATLIVGTAKKGEKKILIPLQDQTLADTFGDIPSDPSEDTSLPKAYLETSRSTSNGLPAFGLVVGDSKKASLELYESQGFGSGSGYGGLGTGDFAYSQDDLLNTLTKCLVHEARIEGDVPNNGLCEVIDENGIPKAITFTTPDGVRKSFGLDPFGKSPNALSNVREIAQAFNADPDWSNWYTTRYGVLRQKDFPVNVQKDATGTFIDINPTGGESYGDKLESLEEIAIVDNDAKDSISLGLTTATLNFLPDKDSNENTRTINYFARKIKDEKVFTVDATLVGADSTNKTIYLGKSNSKWDGSLVYTWNTDPATAESKNFQVDIIKSGSGNKITLPKLAPDNSPVYWIDGSGQIFFNLAAIGQKFQMGDTYLVSYKYKAFYKEANVRSQLETGNEFCYFVKGYDIIFGASTSTELEVHYKTRKVFSASDINITDNKNIIIYFENPLTRPAAGSTVLVTYTYLPELPASSGASLSLPNGDTIFQKTGFSSGDDGRRIGKMRYKELVKEALNLVQSYPFKQILVAGAYLDDTVSDYDDETGLPAIKPVDWLSMLSPIIKERSYLVKECTANIAIRPPVLTTPEAINAWFDRAIRSDAADVGRAANMIEAARGPGMFRFNCIAGAPIMAISQVRSGARFVANPAAVYTGLMQDNIIEKSLTNALLPTSVLGLAVKTLNAKTIGDMNAKKYTFLTEDSAGNLIVADAPTLAVNGSSFDRQFVVQAAFAAIDIIRTTAQRYIGQPRTNEIIIAMKSKCQKNVQYLVPKVFNDIRVDVVEIPDGNITGRTKLKITMITNREIRVVELETRLQIA